jgi:hypothetical protein
MGSGKISYAGIAGSVAGVVGLLGVYANWWESSTAVYAGTADASGGLALAMSLATFAFGGAFVLLSDARIRRAMGALMTLTTALLTIACIWGLGRGEQVAADAAVATGLYVSMMGGAVGVAASILALQDITKTDAEIEAGEREAEPPR